MKFSQKKLPKSQIAMEVQLAQEEVKQHRAGAVTALAKDLRLEGFRPGHVPLALAATHLGEQAVWGEMARLAIAQAYGAIVRQESLDVIGEPEVQVLKLAPGNPLEFRIQVAVLGDVELPDYKKIAGQSAKKEVVVDANEVDEALDWLKKSRKTEDGIIPEATNEFARSLGNFSDLASLRQSIQEGLKHEKEMREKERVRQEIIEKVAERSKLEVPEVLVGREKQVLLAQITQGVAQTLQMTFAEYLQQAGKTEQEILDSLGAEAEQRVKRFLVLREVAKKEGIGPTAQEIEQEANTMAQHYKEVRKAEQDFDPQRLKEYTEGVLRHEKTLQFLESLAA